MRMTKFYKDDKNGGLHVLAIKTADCSYARLGKKPYPTTVAIAERIMARMGFRRKDSLPAELRKRIPQGGLAPNFDLSTSLTGHKA